MVVGADPGSIPGSGEHANTRYDPAEGCGKMLAPTRSSSTTATLRILPILSFASIRGRDSTIVTLS